MHDELLVSSGLLYIVGLSLALIIVAGRGGLVRMPLPR